MLFPSPTAPSPLPPFLSPLLSALPSLLNSTSLPLEVISSFLQDNDRYQCILNLYPPSSGISPHVDLPHRYAEPILGISLLSSVLFEFKRLGTTGVEERREVLLRPRDVYVLTGEARYEWTHGITPREEDIWWDEESESWETLRRRTRMSITLRRMKAGGDVVGGEVNPMPCTPEIETLLTVVLGELRPYWITVQLSIPDGFVRV